MESRGSKELLNPKSGLTFLEQSKMSQTPCTRSKSKKMTMNTNLNMSSLFNQETNKFGNTLKAMSPTPILNRAKSSNPHGLHVRLESGKSTISVCDDSAITRQFIKRAP